MGFLIYILEPEDDFLIKVIQIYKHIGNHTTR